MALNVYLTVSRRSVTEADLGDCGILAALSGGGRRSSEQSADFGRVLRRARKSMALDSIRRGFLRPEVEGAEDIGQRTEDRGHRTEDRGQRTEDFKLF